MFLDNTPTLHTTQDIKWVTLASRTRRHLRSRDLEEVLVEWD
jgi:hypothetical protein